MCVFCVAVPTTAVAGMTLDQKYTKKQSPYSRSFYKRPFLMITILAILILIFLSALVHSRQ